MTFPGLFPEDDLPPVTTYEDRTGALLAHVADLLLTGTPDWNTLERLEAALDPPKHRYLKHTTPSPITYPDGTYSSYTSSSETLEMAYEAKLRKMLEADLSKSAMFKTLYTGGADMTVEYKPLALAPDPKITTELIEGYLKDLRREPDKP
jgi:hypothetical protein